jgi:hypothetical protein
MNAYRTTAADRMRTRDFETIKFIAGRGSDAVDDRACQKLAFEFTSLEVFEAVAHGDLTSDQGALVLMTRRAAERAALPWPVRALLWAWERIA